MCLGVPGKVMDIQENALGMTMGTVSFGGVTKEVCLAYVPEVQPGEFVVVHVGFAISRISEEEAAETFELLKRMGELAELDVPQPDAQRPASPQPGAQRPARPQPDPPGKPGPAAS
ncbi:MAG: HypC/HybG/HupF family hydrogenase formation chaperone [Candidatus Eisenbacteria bacterium]|nr:HypC/HybG/HupF family hydrogenase formation chaperone [Candidatus Eisenbacteria bacterium]